MEVPERRPGQLSWPTEISELFSVPSLSASTRSLPRWTKIGTSEVLNKLKQIDLLQNKRYKAVRLFNMYYSLLLTPTIILQTFIVIF